VKSGGVEEEEVEEGPGRMLELMLQVSAAPAPLSQPPPGSTGASFSRLRPGDDAAAANGGDSSGLA
jgi:hypothetical protein